MQQIARDLSLSRFTVSAVINGYAERRGISARTIERVKEYIAQRGYVPSAQAVALKSGKRNSVGILHCGHLGGHLIQAFNQFAEACDENHGGLEIVISKPDQVIASLQNLVARGIGKLIWIHSNNPRVEIIEDQRVVGALSRMPTVLYNYHFTESDMDEWLAESGIYLVGVSRLEGYRKMARFARELGHRRVYLGDVFRQEGTTAAILSRQFVAAFEEEGLAPVSSGLATSAGDPVTRGRQFLEKLPDVIAKERITAACFRDDEVAATVITGLIEQGIRVPEDLTILSFDDHPLARMFKVPLTTVRIPVPDMVEKTLSLLDEQPASYRHCLPLEIIKRSSHAEVALPEESR